ncbi:hypothetical protein AB0B25_25165 [Nocardia sp. NPDC049190]|uniref:hypothetical protein n=1 Tax=Nocardia sp. NPDC049190 TaxID=3155650 RepID=UPI003403F7C4
MVMEVEFPTPEAGEFRIVENVICIREVRATGAVSWASRVGREQLRATGIRVRV